MPQHNGLNVKLSSSQLDKVKSAIKKAEAILRLSSNMMSNSNDETNFPHKSLLTNRQVPNLRKYFANYASSDIKLSKSRLSKMIQSEGFLGRILGPLLKTGLPLMKNVIKPLIRSVLIPLRLTAVPSAADAGMHKKILGSLKTTLIISNDEIEEITKKVKSLKDSGLFLKGVSETFQNEAKQQTRRFLSTLLGTLGASLLGNMLAARGINRTGEGIIRAVYGSKGSSIKVFQLCIIF